MILMKGMWVRSGPPGKLPFTDQQVGLFQLSHVGLTLMPHTHHYTFIWELPAKLAMPEQVS